VIFFLAYSSIDLEIASSHSSLSVAELLEAKEGSVNQMYALTLCPFVTSLPSPMATNSTSSNTPSLKQQL
jgi:hypothetical protein